jgi:hypothetical protein
MDGIVDLSTVLFFARTAIHPRRVTQPVRSHGKTSSQHNFDCANRENVNQVAERARAHGFRIRPPTLSEAQRYFG